MVDLAPFVGQRFDPEVVGPLADVTAPPYDAIDEEQQRRLHAASPYNVVRLELGHDQPDDRPSQDRYSRAAATHAAWTAARALVGDPRPRLYVYEQAFTHDGSARHQVGVLGALRLVPWEDGQVLPHERVFRGPVEDRKRLLAALPVNLSPVFVLATTTPAQAARTIDEVRAGTPACDVIDDGDVRHRIWPIDDPALHRTLAEAYAGERVLMADGHHRYTTALEHHAEHPGPGTDRILAFVVGADRGPVIRATHRLVRHLPDDDVTARLQRLGLRVEPVGLDADALARAVATDQHAFGVVTRAGCHRVDDPDRVLDTLVDAAPPVDRLGITRLQALLLGPLGVPDRIEDLVYTPDVKAAAADVDQGRADALFLAPAVPFDVFEASSVSGVRMPPKSTSFHPKPRTGLVLRPLASDRRP